MNKISHGSVVTESDREHLRLLSIFYWVVAAIVALCSLVPVIHLVIGLGLASGRLEPHDEGAQIVGWFLVVFAVVGILCGLALAVCLALTASFLARARHRMFCLVIAGIACLFVPLGTVLGVFTIVVLTRESIRELFVKNDGPPCGIADRALRAE